MCIVGQNSMLRLRYLLAHCTLLQCVSMKCYYVLFSAQHNPIKNRIHNLHTCTMTHYITRQPKIPCSRQLQCMVTLITHDNSFCTCAFKWSLLDSREQSPRVLFFVLHLCKTALVCILYFCHLQSDRYLKNTIYRYHASTCHKCISLTVRL